MLLNLEFFLWSGNTQDSTEPGIKYIIITLLEIEFLEYRKAYKISFIMFNVDLNTGNLKSI